MLVKRERFCAFFNVNTNANYRARLANSYIFVALHGAGLQICLLRVRRAAFRAEILFTFLFYFAACRYKFVTQTSFLSESAHPVPSTT